MESILKIWAHVFCNLADAVNSCVSDFRHRVLQMLDHYRNHSLDLLDVIDVFSNLGKRHEASIFVSPICSVCHCILDQLA